MKYFMHNGSELSPKSESRIKKYFEKIKTIESEIFINNKKYKAQIDINSFMWLSNFDCFNCLTNCCVQFPYEFNERARKVILDNLKEYDNLTKAVSILKAEGMIEKEIIESIEKDKMLIPESHVENTFDRCTCSCIHIDRHLCALHKICIDKNFSLKEIIDTKPIWCSIYPLEIIAENDESLLYIFVPTKNNNYLSMNDSEFPCMDIDKSRSPYFRRENPIGFKEEEYKPFIISYYEVLKILLGEKFVIDILENLNLTYIDGNFQYNKKIQ